MPTARTPRARAAAAPVRKPRAPRAVQPEPDLDVVEVSAADAQEAEAAPGNYVTVSLCGEPIRVIPASAWRLSWQTQLRTGDTRGFLMNVVDPEDIDYILDEMDPTSAELVEFVEDATALSGEPMGKSRGRSTSSRSTRRR